MPLKKKQIADSILFWCFTLLYQSLLCHASAFQSANNNVVVPPIPNASIDSQDTNSIDFVLPAGKGRAAIKDWLDKFAMAGWTIEVLDQDSMSAEYELQKNGVKLEIELDDPGIDEAEISISCNSKFQLVIEGTSAPATKTEIMVPATNPVGPKIPSAVFKAPSQANARPGETSLGSVANLDWEIKEGWKPHWWVSPNGRRFACRRYTPSGMTIAVDGSEMGMWDEIVSELVFSPDSRHHAFVAGHNHQGKLWHYLVVDGAPGKAFEKLNEEFAFTADSTQIIFGQDQDDFSNVFIRPVNPAKEAIETGHRFATRKNFFFRGPAGGIGYVASFAEREEAVFWNGKQIGDRYSDIDPGQVAVSADEQHLAFFAAISPVRLGLVVNGKVVREHNQFNQGTIIENTLTLSPNGKRTAWGSRIGGKDFMYLDGKPGPGYEALDFPKFSGNSNRFIYLAMKDGSPLVVIDGVESEKYAMASEPEFSGDGTTIAYYAELNERQFMVVNGKRQDLFHWVSKPTINHDGSIVAYATATGDDDFLIVNGAVKSKNSVVGSPFFIPKSEKLAWLVFDKDKNWRLVVDGLETFVSEKFEGGPVFSSDGKKIAIVAVNDKGKAMMINGKTGDHYDMMVQNGDSAIRFDEAGNCSCLAVRNNEIFLVENNEGK